MCTLVLLIRPDQDWPLILAANRDEMADRPWDPPARHWPDRPDVLAGRDRLGEGSWLGLNDSGVVAAVLNRPHTLGPAPGKRSRGELVLEALDYADAVDAASALSALEPTSYRGFNLVIADNRDAFWLKSDGFRIEVMQLPQGVSMITAHDRNDRRSPRIGRHLRSFQAAPQPDPASGDWSSWIDILARPALVEPEDGMIVVTETGFGTVGSSLIALPSITARASNRGNKPVFLFAAGRPGDAPFLPVGDF